ncbi:MAG: hypothetical protein ACKN9W_20150 [Methylococcus sp.]
MIAFATLMIVTHHAFAIRDIDQAVFEAMRRGRHSVGNPPNHKLLEARAECFFSFTTGIAFTVDGQARSVASMACDRGRWRKQRKAYHLTW